MYSMMGWQSRGVFSCENTPEVCTETHKSSFFPYKQISGGNGDHEWLTDGQCFHIIWFIIKCSEKSCSEQRKKL